MSINRRMRTVSLEKKVETRTTSGANRVNWINDGEINIAIRQVSEAFLTNTVRYRDASHCALTRSVEVGANQHRIIDGSRTYTVEGVNTEGRLTELILKEVTNG